MTDREIRIGDTSSFRYIGIKPPIPETAAGAVMKTLRLPHWMITGMHDSYTQDPTGVTSENQYTEFGYDIGQAEDILGKSHVNNVTVVLAYQIAKILEKQGDTVRIDSSIVPTNFETPLFGKEAERTREINRAIVERRSNKDSTSAR